MTDGLEQLLELIPILRNERMNLALDQGRDQILALRTQGKSYQAIADIFTASGFPVSMQTIRRYLIRSKE